MKILFVANRVPYPPFRGDKLKIYNLATEISSEHEIDLITIAESNDDLSYENELLKVFKSVKIVKMPKWRAYLNTFFGIFSSEPLQVRYFKLREFQKQLDNQLSQKQYDAIHVQHLRMAQYFVKKEKHNVVLDLPDAFSLYWKRRFENASNLFNMWFTNSEYKRLLTYEKLIFPLFPKVLVCSEEDRQYLLKNTGANVNLLPNGVNTHIFYPRGAELRIKGRVLFTGNMDYEPNIDAVLWFVSEIWPAVKAMIPNAVFVIAGQRPVEKVLKLAAPDVLVTGFVESIADEYAKSEVVVAPLRIGAGTQNKVLEALAMEVPVICTQVGFKGLEIENGQGALLATNAADFAEKLISVLENEQVQKGLSGSAGEIIRNKFGWHAISQQLLSYLKFK